MSLGEIGLIAAGGDLRAALDRRRAELERERRLAEERLRALDISLAGDADVVIRLLAAEPVAVMRLRGDVEHAFDSLEAHVRDAGRRAHRPPGAIPSRREIFVPVSGPIPTTERIGYRRLPACRAASIIHRGPYGGVPRARSALSAWVKGAGLPAAGPMRTLYLQFGADPGLGVPPGYVVARDEDFVTELQQPIA